MDAQCALVGQVNPGLFDEALADEQAVFADPEPEARPLNRCAREDHEHGRRPQKEQDVHTSQIVPKGDNERDDRESPLNQYLSEHLEGAADKEDDRERRRALPVFGIMRVHGHIPQASPPRS